ncbi:MAG TPA: POTRA domain-containing protein [Candidatus Acidoferrales bacterium]|nr:POTRA domain-containing protein [Candidatus Acidoferrales bacterium]
MSRAPYLRSATHRLALVLLAFVAGICSPASAQLTPPPGYAAKLLSVDVTGTKNYSSAQVTLASGLAIGETVSRDAIQSAADHLARTGLFSDVHFRFDTDVGGLRVTFQLQDAPSFPISFDNFPWFTDQELLQALQQAGIPLRDTAPASGSILDDASQALEKALASRGVNASVAHDVATNPFDDERLLQFRVVGPSIKIGAIQFGDALAAGDTSVRDQVAALIGKPFSRLLVEQFLAERVRPLYLFHAFLHVQFGTPTAGFSGNPQGPLPSEVVVVAPTTPGTAYTWGGASWSGNQVFSTADLDTLVKTEGLVPGQPADGTKILALWESLRSAYEHRGYLDVQVNTSENFDEPAHQAAYRVAISEGIQYHMGNLVLSGLNPESEKLIRQAWQIPQGQVFDETSYEEFLSSGIADALKGLPASRDKVYKFLQRDPQKATIDVLLDFE